MCAGGARFGASNIPAGLISSSTRKYNNGLASEQAVPCIANIAPGMIYKYGASLAMLTREFKTFLNASHPKAVEVEVFSALSAAAAPPKTRTGTAPTHAQRLFEYACVNGRVSGSAALGTSR